MKSHITTGEYLELQQGQLYWVRDGKVLTLSRAASEHDLEEWSIAIMQGNIQDKTEFGVFDGSHFADKPLDFYN